MTALRNQDDWRTLSDEEWRDLVFRSAEEDVGLPPLAPFNVQQQFNVAPTVTSNLATGYQAYRLIRDALAELGRPLHADSQVLDFGCGWGRVARFFLHDVRPECLHGVDISAVGISASQEAFGAERFRLIEAWPPTDLPAGSFDLVYAISVFSHLPEELHLAWLVEIGRLLKPGGVLVATTLGRQALEPTATAFRAFADPAAALSAYDSGEFVFGPEPRGDYGMTLIPEEYVRRHWPFTIQRFDRDAFPQNVIVAQKRG